MADVEWIVVDPKAGAPWGEPMPFIRVRCLCSTHLVCSATQWGRCKRCGTRPE